MAISQKLSPRRSAVVRECGSAPSANGHGSTPPWISLDGAVSCSEHAESFNECSSSLDRAGGIGGPKRRIDVPTSNANDERKAVPGLKAGESWEVAVLRYCIAKGLMARAAWRSNPTCVAFTRHRRFERKMLRLAWRIVVC